MIAIKSSRKQEKKVTTSHFFKIHGDDDFATIVVNFHDYFTICKCQYNNQFENDGDENNVGIGWCYK